MSGGATGGGGSGGAGSGIEIETLKSRLQNEKSRAEEAFREACVKRDCAESHGCYNSDTTDSTEPDMHLATEKFDFLNRNTT